MEIHVVFIVTKSLHIYKEYSCKDDMYTVDGFGSRSCFSISLVQRRGPGTWYFSAAPQSCEIASAAVKLIPLPS